MMFPEPEYAQSIVVGVVFRDTFAWYITDREYWLLDAIKYGDAFRAVGYNELLPEDYSYRFHIPILNEETAESFLSYIEDRRVPTDALTEMMLVQRHMYEEYATIASNDYTDDILDFSPCLLVDFDQRQFSSLYPELIRFEVYVPDGWEGAYRDFLSEIPDEEKYWMVHGHNLFERQSK